MFFIKRFTLTMDPILTVLLRLVKKKFKFKSGEPIPPRKKWGPRPIRPPDSATHAHVQSAY